MESSLQIERRLTQFLSIASVIILLRVTRLLSIMKVDRPVMHTFYEKTEVGQDDVLKLWKEEWSRAGFDTSVLTPDDANNHPFFEEMEERVQRIFDSSDYQGFCFYRWLAMATVGEWFRKIIILYNDDVTSDHDTYPTNIRPLDMAFLPRWWMDVGL